MAEISGHLKIIKDASNGEDVRDAIINCMNEINKDSAFKVTNKTISEKLSNINKTYSAPAGQVWKQVTLDIQDDTSGETINKGNQTSYDFEVNNYTAPGTYDAKTEHGENAVWGNIIVNVDHSGEWDGIVDNVVISTSDLDETGTYSASTQGLTAVKSITFSDVDPVTAGGGYRDSNDRVVYPMTFDAGKDAEFPDTHKQTKKKDMYAGDSIDITPHPVKTGFTFSGWVSDFGGNGTVNRSETVKANWTSGNVVEGETPYNWTEIIMNKGRQVAIGEYKSLEIDVNIPYSADVGLFNDLPQVCPKDHNYEGTYHYYALFLFVKVATGEGGTESTFVTMLPAFMDQAPIPSHIVEYDERKGDGYMPSDYGQSVKMQWLNSVFLDYCMSTFKTMISPVQKFYRFTNPVGINVNKTANYKIWLPSVREFWITGYDDQLGYPETDPTTLEDSVKELYTKAQGLEYFNNFMQFSNGEQRKAYFEKAYSTYPAVATATFRDMCYGSNQSDVVSMMTAATIQGHDTTVIGSRAVSESKGINPYIIGFCL